MEPIGVGLRAVALIIDVIILSIIIVPLSMVAGQSTGVQLGVGLIALAYFIVMEALKGGTVGKMVMGLKIVKLADGSAISWKESVIRNILRIVDGFFFYLVGAIIIWVSKNKQRLGDIAAATIVVKKSA
jgi:uncharacterized RDD family membrane protein YckC